MKRPREETKRKTSKTLRRSQVEAPEPQRKRKAVGKEKKDGLCVVIERLVSLEEAQKRLKKIKTMLFQQAFKDILRDFKRLQRTFRPKSDALGFGHGVPTGSKRSERPGREALGS